ncbi:TetR/AcrR family transcriptional regulator [Cellulosimicrobium marinum]|uniref:TetR/AcrR family transcriptional regulator n=1 Tax=Cellulosimicrobium marinum TaxID=1638992 RepID=UPI001E34EA62|nr:TetR/AcrR family transcriptional regulator [Cellulosimicrobium marinum]MCB7135071.1 TetR/AcrR family transcriptional regulator [Cellulosimicrobium marinum]
MSKGEETRQEILHRGVEAAYRVGLSGLTIGELARATGLSKSGLYAHFRSKESLQLAVLGQAREEFVDTVVGPALRAPRGEPRLRDLFERWLACDLRQHPGGCLFVKAATELAAQDGPVRDQLVRDHQDLYDAVAQVFRTCVAEGGYRDDVDPQQFASELYGVMLALHHAHVLMADPEAERRARRSFEALLDAARTAPVPAA